MLASSQDDVSPDLPEKYLIMTHVVVPLFAIQIN